jgi:radical SAM superfamily enzyme YgiQ (UPF0313 family)
MTNRVLLFNPPSEFYAMPLGLMAVGSALDPARWSAEIFDARIDPGAGNRLLERAADAEAVGITVFSGKPIGPALDLSRAIKQRHPLLPVIWGGWHPSILPEQCVADEAVDAVVIGQGEATFRDLLEAIDDRSGWIEIPGLCVSGAGGPARSAPRPLTDMNTLAPTDYGLIDVERYFRHKRTRQLDYSSSRGCPYKCTFCADPVIYNSRWTSLSAERTASELRALHRQHAFDEVFFLDDDLFASLKRIRALVEELRRPPVRFGWKGTARADEICRLPAAFLDGLRESGCRRINIGAESGSQRILDRIRKQYRVGEIVEAAHRLAAARIGASYSFIVGFPGETEEDLAATFDVLKQVRAVSHDLEATLYFYAPYPGTELVGELEARGVALPGRTEDWVDFTIDSAWLAGPGDLERRVRDLNFYFRHGYAKKSPNLVRALVRFLARVRCDHDWYRWPVEPAAARFASGLRGGGS